jgi:membrane-associated phospholipid phosphatase
MTRDMHPTSLDLKAIRLLAPFQAKPRCVDAVDILSQNPLANGLVYAVPLFLLWHSADVGQRALAQRMMLTILMGTMIGAFGSLVLQRCFRRPPPAVNPILASAYAFSFREYFRVHPNPNSFPSDSAMLYSTVAFGLAAWSHGLSIGLLAWLLIFVAPAKAFVGGHYPTDILAGLFLGFFSYRISDYLMMTSPLLEALASNQGPPLAAVLFAWLFEVGNEFRDVRQLVDGVWHIRRRM